MFSLMGVHENILGGIGCCLVAIFIGTRLSEVGLRNYALIIAIGVLSTGTIIEHWFLNSSFFTSCLVGFGFGLIADDVYKNIRDTMPDFIKDLFSEITQGGKDKLRSLFNLKSVNKTKESNDE